MYMPLMIDLRRAVVFGGERGEGLQKTQKLSLFADELLVVPEGRFEGTAITLPAGRLSEVGEDLSLPQERVVPVHPKRAHDSDLDSLIQGASFVTSDLSDRRLNEQIASVAKTHNVLCNIIDTKDLCNAWFMSLLESPHLMGGWSTKATATFYVTRLRTEIQRRLPRWEKEAHFTALLREKILPQKRLEVLRKAWSSWRVRTVLRWRGVDAALRFALSHTAKEALV